MWPQDYWWSGLFQPVRPLPENYHVNSPYNSLSELQKHLLIPENKYSLLSNRRTASEAKRGSGGGPLIGPATVRRRLLHNTRSGRKGVRLRCSFHIPYAEVPQL